jgi:hypothetical protein
MRTFTIVTMLMLAMTAAQAQQPTPSAKDILSWISDHLEGVDYNVNDLRLTVSTSLEIQGCQVTIRAERVGEKSDGTFQSTNKYTIGPFNLNNLRPDHISVGSSGQNPRMVINAISAIPVSREQTSAPSARTDGVFTFSWSFVQIDFATKEMANRQAKAWHDAIIGCGGRAVPDNLY